MREKNIENKVRRAVKYTKLSSGQYLIVEDQENSPTFPQKFNGVIVESDYDDSGYRVGSIMTDAGLDYVNSYSWIVEEV